MSRIVLKELQLRNFNYSSRHGLSERLAQNYLKKKGYEVWRGSSILGIAGSLNYYRFERVRFKRDRLENLLAKMLGTRLSKLREQLKKGIPDFLAYRNRKFIFVEVKLEGESLKPHQKECAALLESFGFEIMLVRIKKKVYRAEAVYVGSKLKVRTRQLRLKGVKKRAKPTKAF